MRYKLTFPSFETYSAASSQDFYIPLSTKNEKGLYAALDIRDRNPKDDDTHITNERVEKYHQILESLRKNFDAEVSEDFQYELDDIRYSSELLTHRIFERRDPDSVLVRTLSDVRKKIKAEEAWNFGQSSGRNAKGEGVTIAIVDTGIDGRHTEFASETKRAGSWESFGDTPWTDRTGHGTMCATIAAANSSSYMGVAPEAKLFAAKTEFYDTELGYIYDQLITRAISGEKIVISNSFGVKGGTPPATPYKPVFNAALTRATKAGIPVVFSAGNNHGFSGGSTFGCTPNSIWLHKSRADVMTVAVSDLNDQIWKDSSRGPGQYIENMLTNRKPNVTAPTPAQGEIIFGEDRNSIHPHGWGTSGACPQVAGLMAILWSMEPNLSAKDLYEIVENTAADMGLPKECQGSGLIDCLAAVKEI